MTKEMMKRGFTLIELLVVIAIIGILAATVLAALGNARSSGNDASVQSSVNSTKAQAEIYFTSSSTYLGVCGSVAGGLGTLLTAIAGNAPGSDTLVINGAAQVATAGSQTINCNADAGAWAVSAPLNAGGFFCSDSTGFTGRRTTALPAGSGASGRVCPAT